MRTRLLARAITAIYEEELADHEIKGAQLNLLVAIAQHGPVRRTDISRAMQIDASTLTRNLRVMEENGWIEAVSAGSDGRGAPLAATPAGNDLVARILPAWKRAQQRTREMLDADTVRHIYAAANNLMTVY